MFRTDIPAMCDRHAPLSSPPSAGFLSKACARLPAAVGGSRRRRLWELPVRLHCPVMGVCLSVEAIRRLVDRFNPANGALSDYECHSVCVNAAAGRSALAEQLQEALERRHQLTVGQFRRIRERAALAQRWQDAKDSGDVAAALWAVLTHPLLDAALEEEVYRDIHMIQHQAGAAERIDRRAYESLSSEHAALVREFGKVQRRMTQFAAEKAAQVAQLEAQLLRVRGEAAGHAERLRQREAQLQALCGAADRIAALEATLARLHARVAMQDDENRQLQQALSQTRRELGAARAARPVLSAFPASAVSSASLATSAASTISARSIARTAPARSSQHESAGSAPRDIVTEHLPVQTILCVGGRQGSVTGYRDAVEQTGASFLYHDGGIEQGTQVLEAGLSAADLVICQTGCVSHDAYWRVKDHCKRHGKQCLYVENPSQSAIRRELVNFVKLHSAKAGKQQA